MTSTIISTRESTVISVVEGSGGGIVLPIPSSGLVSMLDGSIAESFYTDIAKTTQATQGQAIAVWEDQSGNGNDWVQSNASYRPTANISGLCVLNAGTYTTSTSIHLTGPNISAWTEGSFFARYKPTSASTALGAIWGNTAWNSTSSVNHHQSGGNHLVCFANAERPIAFGWGGSAFYTALINLEESRTAAGLTKCWVNGIERYSATLALANFRSVPTLGCGIRSNLPSYSIGASIYRFCCYDRILTSEERTLVNAWLES